MDKNNNAINFLINPYYAINISSELADQHTPIVDQEQWVQANLRLIDEIGTREWLEHLLDVLQGDYPVGPDDSGLPGGYKMGSED
jgi:hypothetical protein